MTTAQVQLGSQLNPPVLQVQPGLSFRAQAAMVDNNGGQWLYFADEDKYVAPYFQGVVIAFRSASDAPRVVIQSPNGQGNTGSGNPAVVTFTDTALAGTAGSPTPASLSPTGQLVLNGVDIGPRTAATVFSVDSPDIPFGTWDLSECWVAVGLAAPRVSGYTVNLATTGQQFWTFVQPINVYDGTGPRVGGTPLFSFVFPDPIRFTSGPGTGNNVITCLVSDIAGTNFAMNTVYLTFGCVIRAVTV